jgi:hypothetical protein
LGKYQTQNFPFQLKLNISITLIIIINLLISFRSPDSETVSFSPVLLQLNEDSYQTKIIKMEPISIQIYIFIHWNLYFIPKILSLDFACSPEVVIKPY